MTIQINVGGGFNYSLITTNVSLLTNSSTANNFNTRINNVSINKYYLQFFVDIKMSYNGQYICFICRNRNTSNGTDYYSVYLSNNYGIAGSFTEILSDTQDRTFYQSIAMSSNGQYITIGSSYNLNNGVIYLSNNYGKTFTTIDYGGKWSNVFMDYSGKYQSASYWTLNNNTLNIVYSVNYGITWNTYFNYGTVNYNYGFLLSGSSDGIYQYFYTHPLYNNLYATGNIVFYAMTLTPNIYSNSINIYNSLTAPITSSTTLTIPIAEYINLAPTGAITITLPTIRIPTSSTGSNLNSLVSVYGSVNIGTKIAFRRVGRTSTVIISFIGNGTQNVYNTTNTGATTAQGLMSSGVYIVNLVALVVTGTTYAWFQV